MRREGKEKDRKDGKVSKGGRRVNSLWLTGGRR
jgi:hypothetical protein